MQIKLIGIDLAKNVFQICGINQAGKVVFNRQRTRARFLAELRNYPEVPVVMEACYSAHYWGRTLQAMGHDVQLIPPQHVKPFLRVNKTDACDARAICEASRRPEIHFVPVKSVEQQDLQLLQRLRSRHIRTRTALSNQIRSLAAEYGVAFSPSLQQLRAQLPLALEEADNELSPIAREVLAELADDLRALDRKIEYITGQLTQLASHSPDWQRLQGIPGIGPIIAAALLAATGSGKQFRCGRDFSAWLGLVPRQHSSGNKTRLLGISKNGDRELRALLIHGARAVMCHALRRDDPLAQWLLAVKARRGHNKAIVALANKCARIAWRVIRYGETFDVRKAVA